MLMFDKALFEVLLEGDANGKIFTFPIPTINISKELKDYPLWDLIAKLTVKYGNFYFANFINSTLSPSDVRSMCCRLRLDLSELKNKGGGLFGANPLTGSIGVVTINLARIALMAEGSEERFIDILKHTLNLAKQALELKREIIENFMEKDLYPYSKFYLRGVKKSKGAYFAQHFSTIGVIAGHEACMNLFSKGIESEQGKRFMEKVLDVIREQLIKFQKETGHLYNLEATPGEGISYRFAKKDLESFGDKAYVIDRENPFYTNSTQLPVNYPGKIWDVLAHQESLQSKYTGGTVLHFWMGEDFSKISVKALKNIIFKICENSTIPYFTFTPTFSICSQHGYFAGKHEKCPKCSKEMLIYSRVVGYYRPVAVWNRGKQAEFRYRTEYDVTSF
jgi:ribonucleoside-triphosphate reductase